MKTFTLLAAAAFALTSVAASAIALPAGTYVKKAGASDLYEMESSKLETDSSNPQIAAFAQKMIVDHSKSTADVMAAAQADGVTAPPAALTPTQTAMINELKRTSGKNRDTVYEKQQIQAHTMTLAFQKEYALSGDKPNLKAAAGNIVPVVEMHLAMVKAMSPAGVKAQ